MSLKTNGGKEKNYNKWNSRLVVEKNQNKIWILKNSISLLQNHQESGIPDTNRVERHGGKTMRVMQTKTVQYTAPLS